MAFEPNPRYFQQLENRLAASSFRSSFALGEKDQRWLEKHGLEKAGQDARDFIENRLACCSVKDGRQTPWKGHPVFVAQHATGCCCRGCLEKWHGIPKTKDLNEFEKQYIRQVLLWWLKGQAGSV